jgi:hypothetical protein
LLAAVTARSVVWAMSVDRRCGLPAGTTDPADVLEAAWRVLDRAGDRVAGADDPWAYLYCSVWKICQEEYEAQSLLSRVSRVVRRQGMPPSARRIGATWQWDETLLDDTPSTGPASPLVGRVVDLIVDAGGDRDFWQDAVSHAVDVMAHARRSYEVCELRRDPYLRHRLGLTPREMSALAALLIGPRSGDRAVQSLLLAVSRDVQVTLDDVVGARARVSGLLSRPHALEAPTSPGLAG